MKLERVDHKLVSSAEILYMKSFEGIAFFICAAAGEFEVKFKFDIEKTALGQDLNLEVCKSNYPMMKIREMLKEWIGDNIRLYI